MRHAALSTRRAKATRRTPWIVCSSEVRIRAVGPPGVEPGHPFGPGILSPLRLPVPPRTRVESMFALRWRASTLFLPCQLLHLPLILGAR